MGAQDARLPPAHYAREQLTCEGLAGLSGDIFSIERIMPQNALNSAQWREVPGDDCENAHEELANTSDILTLTTYNPELSDALLAEKKMRLEDGIYQDYLEITKEPYDACAWCEKSSRAIKCTISYAMRWQSIEIGDVLEVSGPCRKWI